MDTDIPRAMSDVANVSRRAADMAAERLGRRTTPDEWMDVIGQQERYLEGSPDYGPEN